MRQKRGVRTLKELVGKLVLVLLLAVLCIGGVELAFCAAAEPELYEEIVAPVRAAAKAAADAGARAGGWALKTGQKAWDRFSESGQRVWDGLTQVIETWWSRITEAVVQKWESFHPPEQEPEELEPVLDEGQELGEPTEVLPIPESALQVTQLIQREEQDYLTGGSWEVRYYDQRAPEWAELPYGSDHIGGYGCGPTAMAMAVSTLTGQVVNPAEMAQWCVQKRHWASRQGSYLSIVQGVAGDYGIPCESVVVDELEPDTLVQRLAAGDLAVALMTKGHFSKGGHFILLRGVTLEGKILVADPASEERSLVEWDLELILDELSPSRHNGAPLWLLSGPGVALSDAESIS